MFDPKTKTTLRRRLLKWFDAHQRDLPWRKKKTPYRIWVSEIMLQQTQVATVIDYFNRFIKRFPNVKRLAAADEIEVLKLWEGLGYYRRARQMHLAAKTIVQTHGGRFPDEFADVLSLPGIGRYTAGAILSISQDQRLPILEGNTIRLYSRLMGMQTDPRSSENQKALWAFSESLLPKKRAGDFNQALMELGSEICTPKNPACQQCPLMNLCPTFKHSWQAMIPAAGKKTVYENVHEAVVLVRKNGKYLVRLCGAGERWTGLWDFPRFRLDANHSRKTEQQLQSQLEDHFGLRTTIYSSTYSLEHAVTRYRIRLDCYQAKFDSGRLSRSATPQRWLSLKQIHLLPMSATGRKIADRLAHV